MLTRYREDSVAIATDSVHRDTIVAMPPHRDEIKIFSGNPARVTDEKVSVPPGVAHPVLTG